MHEPTCETCNLPKSAHDEVLSGKALKEGCRDFVETKGYPSYSTVMEALDKVIDNKLPCPHVCLVKSSQGVEFLAEIVETSNGYCLSALEPTRLWEDIKWKEFQNLTKGGSQNNEVCS
jgi:hypothetical protein